MSLFCVLALVGSAPAQETDELAEKSLPLRTALFHDPTLQAPLDALINLYRGQNRLDELLGLYRTHLSQWPDDEGSTIVYVRLLATTGSGDTLTMARNAVTTFPESAYLRYLLYQALDRDRDPAALETLDAAVTLETDDARRRAWIGQFLVAARAEDRRDLVEKHLDTLVSITPDTPEGALAGARQMSEFGRHDLALRLIERALSANPAPEAMVELQLAAADAQAGAGQQAEAGARLDALLSRLTADYWRRPEILRRRLAMVQDEAERQRLIGEARQRVAQRPDDENAILSRAEALAGLDRRREALDALREGGKRRPDSSRIERMTLEVLDLLRDERAREVYLAERIAAQPDRRDLMMARSRSLFLLGQTDEALASLDAALEGVADGPRVNQMLDVARFLRRSALPADAAKLLERVVAAQPARLDIRRELAELLLALEQRDKALALFSEPLPENASIENFLDLANFLVGENMLGPAKAALEARMACDPHNLDLRVLMLKVHAARSAMSSGAALVVESRALADTPARYRSWIEGAGDFYVAFDAAETFLNEERARLEGERGDWGPAQVERRAIFAEAASRMRVAAPAIALLRSDLGVDPPAEVRLELRRRLVGLLTEDLKAGEALREELERLAADAPQAQDEINARMALLHVRDNRHDLAQPLLQRVDPANIGDATLLRQLEGPMGQFGMPAKVLTIVERLTQLNPADRGVWERWLTTLAAMGDEEKLRGSVRRLLAGVEKMPLSDETNKGLRRALVQSYWRSIARRIGGDDPAMLPQTLALLDEADRVARDDREALWIAWTRAHVLNRLGLVEERDAAVAELDRLATWRSGATRRSLDQLEAIRGKDAAEEAPDAAPGAEPEVTIAFPDGMSVSLEWARRLVTQSEAGSTDAPAGDAIGPLPEGDEKLAVRWVYDHTGAAAITWVRETSGGAVLIADVGGQLVSLDARTGKMRWRREGALPDLRTPQVQPNPYGGWQPPVPMPAAPRFTLDESGRVIGARGGEVWCVSSEDGRTLWRTALPGWPQGTAQADAAAIPQGGRVVVFDPLNHRVHTLDATTGKVTRVTKLKPSAEGQAGVAWMTTGASLDGRRLLVHGSGAAILDVDTGETIWRFEPGEEGMFPLRLTSPEDEKKPTPTAVSGAAAMMHGSRVIYHSGGMYYGGPYGYAGYGGPMYMSYMQPSHMRPGNIPPGGVVMTAPAVAWASNPQPMPKMGLLMGERLVLLSQQGSHVLRLDLPLTGNTIGAQGAYVGSAGPVVCLLNPGALVLLNTRTGAMRSFPLHELTDNQHAARVTAAVDGTIVHLIGPKAVVGVSAITGRQVYLSPWPQEVEPQTAGTQQQMGMNYLFQGRIDYQPNTGQPGPCMPVTDAVGAGVLYATPTTNRVVALVKEAR